MLIGRKVTSFLSCHSFLRLGFNLDWKHVAFTWLAYTCEEALGSKVWWKYYRWGRERSIKEAEKNPSAAVVAGVRSTGATVVGSVNATEFWQRRTRSPSFLLLLSRKMELAIPQWSTLRPVSRMIYYNYPFCDNYFRTCFLHWRAVFGKNPLTKLRLFHGCSDKSRWRKQKKKKKATIVAKTIMKIDYLAAWWKWK